MWIEKEVGVLAAIRHFPDRRDDIEALAKERESFRDMCDELVAAEAALSAVERLDEATRAERRLEWLSYIRGTLAEIDAELRRVNVISLDRRSRKTQ